MSNPLVSIITAVYNGENTIEKSIKSIVNQTYSNIEYIIVDGNSSDKTLEVVQKYSNDIDIIISEKDSGIGDAWNKGILKSNGEIIGLLNADDMYDKNTIKIVVDMYMKNNSKKNAIFYGTCNFIENNKISNINKKDFNPRNLLKGFGFVHTTCFAPSEIYKTVGLFNINIKIAVDTDFLIRCYVKNIDFIRTELTVYMAMGGVSDKKFIRAYFEYLDILKQYKIYNNTTINLQKIIFIIYSPFRYIIKSEFIKNILRQIKHLAVSLNNLLYSFIPTFYLKNLYLKFIGINIGDHSYIHPNVTFYRNNNLKIGQNTVINKGSIIDNRNMISIGSNVSIAHNVKIYTCGHDINSPYFDMLCKPVIIEDYVCIFANVIILPGITIKKGAVLYPGSVITKDVSEYSVVGGNPASFIKNRDKDLYYNIDYGYWKAL
jgi:acetyltransferase-like isoleucine patch superfamily enzyme